MPAVAKISAPTWRANLDSREANAAGRRMDQTLLSRAEPAQVFEGIRRREEGDRQRRGLLEAEPGGLMATSSALVTT